VTRARAYGGYAAVAAFALLSELPFLGKPFTIDEPFFLAPVAQILKDPLHPMSFTLNWLGRTQSGPEIFNHSILTSYFLAGISVLTRGSEFGMRLACLPVDLAAACALYWLAARFLKRPLWPVLLVLAGPAWFLGMPLLMAEKWMMCSVLLAAVALIRGLDDDPISYWLSAVLISVAITLKSTAAVMLLPAAAMQWPLRKSRGRLALYLLVCLALPAVDALWLEPWRALDTIAMMRNVNRGAFAQVHRLRALLAFPAACGLVIAALPFAPSSASPRRRLWTILGSLLAAALVFAPFLDLPGRAVEPLDRLLGVLFAFGTLATLVKLLEPRSRRLPGARLWLPWIFGGMAISWFNYFISARSILLFLPAVILACAERLQEERERRSLDLFYGSCFAVSLVLSLLLARVDVDYADAQRAVSRMTAAESAAPGRKVWFTGHWGLQYYMERAGASALDAGAGGWSAVRPGDVAVIPLNNTMQLLPPPDLRFKLREIRIGEPIPLRLIDVGRRQAGFYASPFGFLPYAVSLEPLDVFTFVEVL
jgi:hypothetical protein